MEKKKTLSISLEKFLINFDKKKININQNTLENGIILIIFNY